MIHVRVGDGDGLAAYPASAGSGVIDGTEVDQAATVLRLSPS